MHEHYRIICHALIFRLLGSVARGGRDALQQGRSRLIRWILRGELPREGRGEQSPTYFIDSRTCSMNLNGHLVDRSEGSARRSYEFMLYVEWRNRKLHSSEAAQRQMGDVGRDA